MGGNYCLKTDWALLHLWESDEQLIACYVMTYFFPHIFFFIILNLTI